MLTFVIQQIFGSTVLDAFLSSKIFLICCMIVYFAGYNFGYGPIKFILLSEMFTTEEQVKSENIASPSPGV